MSTDNDVLKQAIFLDPTEKAKLVDHLISSLDKPDNDIDKLWADENSEPEDRFLILGLSNELNNLLICHCEKNSRNIIRINSAKKQIIM